MFLQIFGFSQLWYSLGLGGHLFTPNSPFSSNFFLGCCEIDPETEEKQPVQILCSPGQTEDSSSMNHNNSSKTIPYWIFKVSNLSSCCIYSEHNWVLEHWTFPKTSVAEKNTPNFVLNLVRPSLHTHSSDLKHATKPNIVTGEKMHTQKRIFFFWPFVVVCFCSPRSSSSSNSDHKKHRDFHNLCPLFLSLVNKPARTRAHTRAEEAALETELPQSLQQQHTAPQLLHHHHRRQSVSQISKSQNARPPECQIPRWCNPRNALQKNQAYKNYHRNDDERGGEKKTPTDLIDLSAALTHSLLFSGSRQRSKKKVLYKATKEEWGWLVFWGLWREMRRSRSNNNTLLLRGAKAKLRNFLVQDRCASATTSLFCWDQTAEDDKRKDKNTAAGSSCRVVAGSSGARLPSSPCIAPGLTLFHMPKN